MSEFLEFQNPEVKQATWLLNQIKAGNISVEESLSSMKVLADEQLQRENDELRAERKEIEAAAVEKILNWDRGYSIDHEGHFYYEHSAIEAYVNDLRQQGGE